MIKIAPSILSADFSDLKSEIESIRKGGADWVHLDIMDGHFVPNITFGAIIVQTIRSLTNLPLDCHLMIEKPDYFLEDFKKAGCDILTVHSEVCPHLHRTIQNIKELKMKAGVALNPSTPVSFLKEIIPFVDLILIMTVNPGFGGQKFITSMLNKINEANEIIRQINPNIFLEVDGGVSEKNAAKLVGAGANVLVAGYSIFSKNNVGQAIRLLRKAAQN